MKVALYIQKKDFDQFFIWFNRLNQGVLLPSPVEYTNLKESIKDPLQIHLSADEYALIQDTESALDEIKITLGDLEILYEQESLEIQKKLILNSLKKTERYNDLVELVLKSIEIAANMDGITPFEAIVIAERELGYE